MGKTREPEDSKESIKRLAAYFSWRTPYSGDEEMALKDAEWALAQTRKKPEELAVFLLELVNERNSLARRMRAVSAIATNQDFVETATVKDVEWAFGKKLRTSDGKRP